MSGKIYNRTMDDGFAVTDPRDRQVEFCLTAHVHFMARDMNEAMSKLAEYFARSAGKDEGDKDKTFHAGTMTVGKSAALHSPLMECNSEVTH